MDFLKMDEKEKWCNRSPCAIIVYIFKQKLQKMYIHTTIFAIANRLFARFLFKNTHNNCRW